MAGNPQGRADGEVALGGCLVTTACFAQVNRVTARWSPQRINFYAAAPCSKAATAVLVDKDGNQRHFCTTHQRMALQLRVRQDGTTPEPPAAADIRRIERRDRIRYDWGSAGWTRVPKGETP